MGHKAEVKRDEFVDLCYIDPPFLSNKNYEVIFGDGEEIRSFEDGWKGGIENDTTDNNGDSCRSPFASVLERAKRSLGWGDHRSYSWTYTRHR
jgi:hypothetical protein